MSLHIETGAIITNARPKGHDALRPRGITSVADPRQSIVVRPQQPMTHHMLELGHGAQSALELPLRQVQGVVVDGFARGFEGVEEDAYFAQVSKIGVSEFGGVLCRERRLITNPLPSSMTIDSDWMFRAISSALCSKTSISAFVT